MKKTQVDLATVKARDIMREDVLRLDVFAPIESAVRTLEDYKISGAPVTDDAGRLLGVLSLSDVAKSQHMRDHRLDGHPGEYFAGSEGPEGSDDPEWEEDEILDREDYSPDLLGQERVGDWMNRGVIHVAPDDSLASVCKLMVKNQIHRVLVVERGALKGIITSFDVVRFLAELE